jgi:peptidoglycan L-alanyl-D-glutamate endopeptidase CwlK
MGNSMDELASYMRPKADQLVAEAMAKGLDPLVIDTGRTSQEQSQKLKTGVSWTNFSKHEPQPPEMKSEAIDVAIRPLIKLPNWDPSSPLWAKLGAIGKSLGLLWGGDWIEHPDPSHFEWHEQKVDEA